MIDARGLSCPKPVLMLMEKMKEKLNKYEIIVDNNIAKENISRYATSQGYTVKAEAQGEDIYIEVLKS